MTERQFHAVADLFPRMPEDELQALADDIKANGLLVAIKVDASGAIIDGRHRFEACQKAGVEPRFETVNGVSDLVSLVASLNAKRRNLSASQRAIAAAEAWDMVETQHGGARTKGQKQERKNALNGKRSDALATMFGVGARYVEQARAVVVNDPAAAIAVKAGAVQLADAYKVARERQAMAQSETAWLAMLQAEAPDLASMVVEGQLKLPEAMAAKRHRDEEARQRRAAAMRLVYETLQRICPAAGDPAPVIDQIWADWSAADYPEGTPKLSAENLHAASAVLSELANRMTGRKSK